MYKLKLRDALTLLRSSIYILVTQKTTSLFGNFDGFDKQMKLQALREARDELDNQIKLEQKKK